VTAAATAVVFDLGGVITESPMTAFTAYEAEAGLPEGLIVRLNSTDPDTNAWARFERNELDAAGFTDAFEAEALAAGHEVDARRVLAALAGELRPQMVEAVRRLRAAGVPLALLSNNVAPMERTGRLGELLGLFDVVVESSVEGVRKLVPAGASMAAFALKWILMNEAVTVVIPGARNVEQAKGNAAAAELAAISADVMTATREIYARLVAPHVHQRW